MNSMLWLGLSVLNVTVDDTATTSIQTLINNPTILGAFVTALFGAIAVLIVAFINWRKTYKIERAKFVDSILNELRFGSELSNNLQTIIHDIRWNDPNYDPGLTVVLGETRGFTVKLMTYFSYICYLRKKKIINKQEMELIDRTMCFVCTKKHILGYLWSRHFLTKINYNRNSTFNYLITYLKKENKKANFKWFSKNFFDKDYFETGDNELGSKEIYYMYKYYNYHLPKIEYGTTMAKDIEKLLEKNSLISESNICIKTKVLNQNNIVITTSDGRVLSFISFKAVTKEELPNHYISIKTHDKAVKVALVMTYRDVCSDYLKDFVRDSEESRGEPDKSQMNRERLKRFNLPCSKGADTDCYRCDVCNSCRDDDKDSYCFPESTLLRMMYNHLESLTANLIIIDDYTTKKFNNKEYKDFLSNRGYKPEHGLLMSHNESMLVKRM